jgi:hypothetical protein
LIFVVHSNLSHQDNQREGIELASQLVLGKCLVEAILKTKTFGIPMVWVSVARIDLQLLWCGNYMATSKQPRTLSDLTRCMLVFPEAALMIESYELDDYRENLHWRKRLLACRRLLRLREAKELAIVKEALEGRNVERKGAEPGVGVRRLNFRFCRIT